MNVSLGLLLILIFKVRISIETQVNLPENCTMEKMTFGPLGINVIIAKSGPCKEVVPSSQKLPKDLGPSTAQNVCNAICTKLPIFLCTHVNFLMLTDQQNFSCEIIVCNDTPAVISMSNATAHMKVCLNPTSTPMTPRRTTTSDALVTTGNTDDKSKDRKNGTTGEYFLNACI